MFVEKIMLSDSYSWAGKKIKFRCILDSLTEESTSLLPKLKLRSGRQVAGSGFCLQAYRLITSQGRKAPALGVYFWVHSQANKLVFLVSGWYFDKSEWLVFFFSLFPSRTISVRCSWKSLLCCTWGFAEALWTWNWRMECWCHSIHLIKWSSSFLGR